MSNFKKVLEILNPVLSSSLRSDIDPQHKQKEKKKLTDFKLVRSDEGYTNDPIFDNALVHPDVDRYLFIDEQNRVAAYLEISKSTCSSDVTIPFLKISDKYRGCALGYQLLDFAVKKLGANRLAVDPDNKIALRMYQNYGFEITEESKEWVNRDPENSWYRIVLKINWPY